MGNVEKPELDGRRLIQDRGAFALPLNSSAEASVDRQPVRLFRLGKSGESGIRANFSSFGGTSDTDDCREPDRIVIGSRFRRARIPINDF